MAKPVHNPWKAPSGELLSHAAYLPDLTRSDYHLFTSLGHALAEQRFGSYKVVNKWFAAKGEDFY